MSIMKKQKSYQIIGRNGTMNKLGKGNEQSVYFRFYYSVLLRQKREPHLLRFPED